MRQKRLNGLAHMHIQYSVDIEAVINLFATSGRARRLNIILCHAIAIDALLIALIIKYIITIGFLNQ